MAATRLITMHVNKGKSLAKSIKDRTDYAANEEKTEHGEFISSYACDPKTVDEEFLLSKKEYLRITGRQPKGDIIAYQIRQSFKPGEITPEEANKVGYETAARFTKGNHAFIVATHVDKAHIHNHVIFNSTNLTCDRKFRDFFFVGIALQRLSDLVCLEHGLSVIKPRKPSQREKREEYPKRKVFRDEICDVIDQVLLQKPESFEKALCMLEEQGYEIKKGTYLSVKGKNQKRFIRFRSLGEGYTVEDLEKIISGDLQQDTKQPEQRKQRFHNKKSRDFDLLIDIQEKIKQGKGGGYTKWAKVYNIKQLSQSLLFLQQHDIRDYEEFSKRAGSTAGRFNELSKSIKEAEKRLAEIAVLRTHIINYSKTRDVYVAYRKLGYSKKFFEAHREEITLHKAAKEAFSDIPDAKIPKIKELNTEYAEVLAEKKKVYVEYRMAKKEMQNYLIAKQNIDAILREDEKTSQQEKSKEKHNLNR